MVASNGHKPIPAPHQGWELLGEQDDGYEWARRRVTRTPPKVRRPRVRRSWGKWGLAILVGLALSAGGYLGYRVLVTVVPPADPPAVVAPSEPYPDPPPTPIIIVPSESRTWAESILQGPARLRLRSSEIQSGERAVETDYRTEREARDEW